MNIQFKLTSCLRLLSLLLLATAGWSHAQGLALRWQTLQSSVMDAGREQHDGKVARDASGNIFTAAGTDDGRTIDWVVRKLAAGTGAVLWERRLAAPNNELNVVAAITVDFSGNPSVTGTSSTPGFSDYYTAKFSGSTGDVVWEKRLSGPGSFWDEPTDIDTDNSGNVIVTGISYTNSLSSDYLTVKYAAATGNVMWEKRHTASSSSDDRAYAVEVDAADNVLVAGSTDSRAGVIKYSGVNGAVLWDRRHTVPAGTSSQALDLALDAAGNAFITGSVGPATGFKNFLTLRFAAANGNIDWDQRISGAANQDHGGTDIAVDSSGNVVVAGFTQPTANLAAYKVRMAKYSGANGSLLWGKTTDYAVESFDREPARMALDPGGNVLLTGTTSTGGRTAFLTAKFATANGNLLWEKTFVFDPATTGFQIFQIGHAVIAGSDSSVIVTGVSNGGRIDVDHLTIKYNASGTQVWQSRYNGTIHRPDWPGAVAVDRAGDAIIAGAGLGTTGFREFVLTKVDGDTGAPEWKVRRARTSPTDHDVVVGVAADNGGNVILAGISDESSVGDSIYLAKFATATGAVLWERRFKPSAAITCRLTAMALDASGNILVTGGANRSSSSGDDIYTAKYNGVTGALIWEQYFTSTSNKPDNGRGIAVDSAGNALVAGELTNLANDPQMMVIKYSGAIGTKLWERAPTNRDGRLSGIAVDPQGNPVVTGVATETSGPGLFAAKYASATGAIVWEQFYDGATRALGGEGVATDSSGNVFVTGYARSARVSSDYDFITLKYDAATGSRLWENAYNGPFDEDRGMGIVVDSSGNPVVTGLSEARSAIFDLYTAKYSGADGSILGSHRQTASVLEQDFGDLQRLFIKFIEIGPSDRVVVGGLSRPTLDDNDIVGLLYETPAPQIAIERLPAGTAVPAASAVDAGSIVGSPQISFRIRNTGTGALTFGTPEVAPGASGGFTVTPPATFSLQPGASTTFTIGMLEIPGGGQGSGTVSLTHNAPSGSTFQFTLNYLSPSTDAGLLSLATDAGVIGPAFDPGSLNYWLTVPPERGTIRLTPVASSGKAAITMNGQPVTSGSESPAFDLGTGTTAITTQVTAEDGVTVRRYTVSVTRLPASFLLGASNVAPVTSAGFSATGHDIRLQFADPPQPGRTIKVVENTALPFIQGNFGNLQHGQEVILQHEGRSYAYVANYHGGSGNDLTLHWKSNTVAVWGDNSYGQLANGNNTDGTVPALVTRRGVLAGKTVIAVAAGRLHCLALCSDGTVASWGDGFLGKLGYGQTAPSYDPVAVDRSGVLAGKTVVAISAGEDHGLALCSDGTLAAWGSNSYGQLGDNRASGGFSLVPVAVDRGGVLAGKTVVAIAAGSNNNLVLCSDGTLAAWGDNGAGQLGNPGAPNSRVPLPVLQTGVLAGKQVTAISASSHCLALCADGAIASWGYNAHGQVGDNSTTNRGEPVLVRVAGALSGRTPVAVAAGDLHSLALGNDGIAIGWGANSAGQIGIGSTVNSPPFGNLTPVAMNTGNLLDNRKIAAISAGKDFSLVTCTDGTPGACGVNSNGELGNGTLLQNALPGPVSVAGLPVGSQLLAVTAGPRSTHGIAIVPLQPPSAVTVAADVQGARRAVLSGRVSTVGSDATVSFEWGETGAYGRTAGGIPSTVAAGAGEVAVIAPLNFLRPGTTYHYRVRAENAAGVSFGENMTFTTPNDNAFAASLAVDAATLVPAFNRLVSGYSATLPFGTDRIVVDVVTEDPRATATVEGAAASVPVTVELPVGTKAIEVIVTAEDRTTTRTYVLHVTRLPARFVYDTGSEVPVTSPRFVAPAIPVTFELNHAPVPGTVLTVVRSAGLDFISGRFSNLAQGQLVVLDHGGTTYRFTANYYGGSGNDLVLQWADTRLQGWGANANGQLGAGDGTRVPWYVPAPIPAMTEPRLLATATGYMHSLALAADGTVLAWGYNAQGQLGDGSTRSRPDPAPVVPSGALAGKRVIAVAAGAFHSLALCDDGTVAAWGYNNYGQLGNGTTITSAAPVAVERAGGLLAGKTVVSIAAGAYHSLALCSDGSVYAWGFNETGALGNNSTTNSSVPVSVRFLIGALQATGISAGQYHNLAIREGVALVAWGYNPHGQLGTGNTTQQNLATPVPQPAGLAGKSPRSVAAGASHSLALFEDGTLAAWGLGTSGQLGDGSSSTRLSPVAVPTGSALSGKSPAYLAAGDVHSLVGFTDGSAATWGGNLRGQLGTGSTTSSPLPVLIEGSSFMAAGTGSTSSHVLVLQPLPASPGSATAASVGVIAPVTVDAWRMLHFGHAGNSGEAADLHDPDQDGVPNLVEFAFGLDPRRADAGLLPAATRSGSHLVIEFTERPGLEGVGFKASSTRDLRTWTSVPDEGVEPRHRFRLPIGEDRGFMRIEVEER